jgi:hypothetical protein
VSTPPRQPTEEELRAAYEAELKRITVEDVAVQTTVSLINLAGRRIGLAPGTEDERDLEQVRDAIDAARALMPILERRGVAELRAIRDGLSQLQLAYAKERDRGDAPPAADAPEVQPTDGPSAEGEPAAAPPGDEGPGPAQASGRLWVPGQ